MNVLPCVSCREVIALVNKVLPVYIIFQLFEAVCVSTALVGSLTPQSKSKFMGAP